MKRIILVALTLISFKAVKAQIDPLYAQYINNPLVINPAYTGFNNNVNATVAYRRQWAGFEGNPTTINASAHSSILQQKMGIGFMAVQDNIGATKNTEVNLTYSYKLDFGHHRLAFGIQGGMMNYRTSSDNLNPYDPDNWEPSQNITKPNLGAGVILSSERYFIGLSSPRMLTENSTVGNSSTSIYKQHLYGMLGYIFILSERMKFKPSLLVKGVQGAPMSADLNTSIIIDDRYTAGLFTRNLNTYGVLLQVRMDKGFRFGYIFEVPSNKSVGVRYPTHELCVGISMAVLKAHHDSHSNF